MIRARPATRLLDRLRASTRLAAFALLLFALKLGVAAACVGHDMADLGFDTASGQTLQQAGDPMQSTPGGDSDPTPTTPTPQAHADSCAHGNGHQTADVVVAPNHCVVPMRHSVEIDVDTPPPGALPQEHLRPPIV